MRYGYCTMTDKRVGQEKENSQKREKKNGSNRLSTIRIRASDIISIRVWLFFITFIFLFVLSSNNIKAHISLDKTNRLTCLFKD